ncbi:MAG: 50S ribosomal protein L19 [Patescibacteria group bacterium]
MQKSAVIVSPVDMEARKNLGIRSGDTVRVWQKIEELKKVKQANKKEALQKNVRRQAFEGLVLAVKHGSEPGGTFTVRRVASGVGVERVFPLYAPTIAEIEVLRRARTRRAKLYFIRRKAAREVSHAMRKQIAMDNSGKRTDTKQTAAPAAEAPQTAEAAVE